MLALFPRWSSGQQEQQHITTVIYPQMHTFDKLNGGAIASVYWDEDGFCGPVFIFKQGVSVDVANNLMNEELG